jgi:hypothetical protein
MGALGGPFAKDAIKKFGISEKNESPRLRRLQPGAPHSSFGTYSEMMQHAPLPTRCAHCGCGVPWDGTVYFFFPTINHPLPTVPPTVSPTVSCSLSFSWTPADPQPVRGGAGVGPHPHRARAGVPLRPLLVRRGWKGVPGHGYLLIPNCTARSLKTSLMVKW